MNRCVRVACPPNFKVSRDDNKCKPAGLKDYMTTTDCIKSLKIVDSRKLLYEPKVIGLPVISKDGVASLESYPNWSLPCKGWSREYVIPDLFGPSCQITHKNNSVSFEDLYLMPTRGYDIFVLICVRRYYYKSKCLLHFLNELEVTTELSADDSLIVITKDGKEIEYPIDQYLPFGETFGVCIHPAEEQLPTTTNLRHIQSLVAAVGSTLSILFFAVVLITFQTSPEHFPGYGLISMCCCLMISDGISVLERTLYFADIIVSLHTCKCLAVVNLFVMLTEQCCIVVLAVDNFITFRRVAIHINESMKVYYRRRICSLVIPILLTLAAVVLDYNDSQDQGFGRTSEKDFCILKGTSFL